MNFDYLRNCCGSPTYRPTVSPPPKGCDVNCLYAPKISWLCSEGPKPGEGWTFSIREEASKLGVDLLEDSTFSLVSYDKNGYDQVVINENGDVALMMKKVYVEREYYKIKYRIKDNNSVRSVTGEITICSPNQCKDCLGICNEVTSSCVYVEDINRDAECESEVRIDISNWSFTDIDSLNVTGNINSVTIDGNDLVVQMGSEYAEMSYFDIKAIYNDVSMSSRIRLRGVNKCTGRLLRENEICNQCTGEISPEIQISQNSEIKITRVNE